MRAESNRVPTWSGIDRKRNIIVLSILLVAAMFQSAPAEEETVGHLPSGWLTQKGILDAHPELNSPARTLESASDPAAYTMNNHSWLMQEPSPSAGGIETVGEKSPSLAFALSFLLPGLGQHYNEQHVKGFVQEAIFLAGAGFVLADLAGGDSFGDDAGPLVVVGFSIAIGAYVWSMIDAPISASRINKELERSRQSSGEMNLGNDFVGVGLGLSANGARGGVSWRF